MGPLKIIQMLRAPNEAAITGAGMVADDPRLKVRGNRSACEGLWSPGWIGNAHCVLGAYSGACLCARPYGSQAIRPRACAAARGHGDRPAEERPHLRSLAQAIASSPLGRRPPSGQRISSQLAENLLKLVVLAGRKSIDDTTAAVALVKLAEPRHLQSECHSTSTVPANRSHSRQPSFFALSTAGGEQKFRKEPSP